MSRSRQLWLLSGLVAIGSFPGAASAHVKWFANYNLQCRPVSPLSLLQDTQFILFAIAVTALMFVVMWIDRKVFQYRIQSMVSGKFDIARHNSRREVIEHWSPIVLRLAVAAFFLTLFLMTGGADQPSMILTFELKSYAPWLRWMQLVIACCALFQRTAWISALGIVVLFIKATDQYGLFHMIDYPIFLGVAAYIFQDSWFRDRYRMQAQAALRLTTAFSLMWGGIEKLVFPDWTIEILHQRPYLSMGFNEHFFVTAAAFVEFCAAFLVVVGQLSARLCALLLVAIMSIGCVIFGTVDTIGHSVILIVLLLLSVQDVNPLTQGFEPALAVNRRRAVETEASNPRLAYSGLAYSGIFVMSLMGLLMAYTGGHYLAFHLHLTLV